MPSGPMVLLSTQQRLPSIVRPLRGQNRRLLVVVHSGFGTESLERAIQTINRALSEHEQRRQKASRADAAGRSSPEVEVQQTSRPITFKASAKTEKLVKEPRGPPAASHGLSAYLSLPLDQYSLLDPGWISRCPGSPDMFVLRIPLFDLVGLELQPQISVRVASDPRNSQVHFLADQFKLGDPRFDADLKLAMRATLRNKPVPTLRPFRSIRKMWSRTRRGQSGGDAGGSSAAGTALSGSGAGPAATGAEERHGAGTGTVSSDDEGVIVEVEGADDSDGEAGFSERGRGGYNPVAVLDVGMGGGAGGTRGAPDLPPHVTVLDERGAGATGTHSLSSLPPNGVDSGARASGRTGSSAVACMAEGPGLEGSSRSNSNGGASGDASASGRSPHRGAAQHPARGVSGSGNGGGGTVGDVIEGGGTSSTGQWPRDAASGHSHSSSAAARPAADTGASPAASRAVIAEAEVLPVPVGASANGAGGRWPPGASSVPAPRPLQPDGVVQAAAASPAAVSAAAAETDAGPLPFIEDSVLYVPASQWGRTEDAAATGTSGSRGSGAAVSSGAAGSLGAAQAARPPLGSGGAGSNGATATPRAPGAASGQEQDAAAARGGGVASPGGGSARVSAGEPHRGTAASAHSAPCSTPSAPLSQPAVAQSSVQAQGDMRAAGGSSSDRPVGSQGPAAQGQSGPQVSSLHSGSLHAGAAGVPGPSARDTPQTPPGAHAAASAQAARTGDSVGSRSSGSRAAAGAAAGDEGSTALLVGSVDVSVTVMVPPALAAVPRPLLGMTGSLVARYALSSLLPSFLDLLAADYGRWASGQTVAARAAPAGDFAATAAANAAAMGNSAGLSAVQQSQQAVAAATAEGVPAGGAEQQQQQQQQR